MREKTLFIKLMMLTTSDNDNEALLALRKANAALARQNMNWEEFLNGQSFVYQREETKQKEEKQDDRASDKPRVYTRGQYGRQIDILFEILFNSVPPTSSFRHFVKDVHKWWIEKEFLTPSQYDAIRRSAMRAQRG